MSRLFLVAGEPSGDLHGGHLAGALRQLDPAIELYGIGGETMRTNGVRLLKTIDELAVNGLVDVFKRLPFFIQLLRWTVAEIERLKPRAVILIDYPGFNLRLAKALQGHGIPLIYYIAPQLWAWGRHRAKILKACVKKLLVVFPFEVEFFGQCGILAEFVGHPLLEQLPEHLDRQALRAHAGIRDSAPVVALLPGSRLHAVRRHLPLILRAACEIQRAQPQAQFLLAASPLVGASVYQEALNRWKALPATILTGRAAECVAAADVALVSAGTASLETALVGTPMVIFYRSTLLNYLLARPLIETPHVGMANILAGRRVVPELVQFQATPQRLAHEALGLLNGARRQEIQRTFAELRASLGGPGASLRAARAILATLPP